MGDPIAAEPSVDDLALLRRLVAGDAGACRIVERWARETIAYRGFRLTAEDREDALQDTVAGVWSSASRSGFQLARGLRALVRTIAVARCIDRLRRARPTEEVRDSLQDALPGPLERLLASDEAARVRWAILELDERCREIIRLRFFEEQDYAQIAAREDRTESTMRVRMFNCMKAIRNRLTRWRGSA